MKKLLLGLLIILVLVGGCKVGYSSAKITDAKICTGVDKDGIPVGVATTFSIVEPKIHIWFSWANAPSGTKIGVIFNHIPGGGKVVTPELTLTTINGKGSFHLAKPAGDRPTGDYRVDLYMNEKVVRSLNFKVK